MCAPAVVGLAMAGISAYQQNQAGKTEAEVARNNARLAGWQGTDAIQRGAHDARRVEIEGRRIGNDMRVGAGKNNIDSNSGSMANLITASNAAAGADADRLRSNAARAAWGYLGEEQDLLLRGRQARHAGYMGALGTAISGAGQAFGEFGKWYRAGPGRKSGGGVGTEGDGTNGGGGAGT